MPASALIALVLSIILQASANILQSTARDQLEAAGLQADGQTSAALSSGLQAVPATPSKPMPLAIAASVSRSGRYLRPSEKAQALNRPR